MNTGSQITLCVPHMSQAGSNDVLVLSDLMERDLDVVLRDVTAFDTVCLERYVVSKAYQFFADNPKATRRDYILHVAQEQLPPMFSVQELAAVLPFSQDNAVDHSYGTGALTQMLSLAERDGDAKGETYTKRLRAQHRDMWVVLPLEQDSYTPAYGKLFDQFGIGNMLVLQNRVVLIAAQIGCSLEELLFRALIGDPGPNALDWAFFDFLESDGTNLSGYSIEDFGTIYTLKHLSRIDGWFNASTAVQYIIEKGAASPIRFASHEGAGQYFRRIFAVQTKRGSNYYPKNLIRKRAANSWVWKVQ